MRELTGKECITTNGGLILTYSQTLAYFASIKDLLSQKDLYREKHFGASSTSSDTSTRNPIIISPDVHGDPLIMLFALKAASFNINFDKLIRWDPFQHRIIKDKYTENKTIMYFPTLTTTDNISLTVFVGDFLDRGLLSYYSLEFYRYLKETYPNIIFGILGNHEDGRIFPRSKVSGQEIDEEFRDEIDTSVAELYANGSLPYVISIGNMIVSHSIILESFALKCNILKKDSAKEISEKINERMLLLKMSLNNNISPDQKNLLSFYFNKMHKKDLYREFYEEAPLYIHSGEIPQNKRNLYSHPNVGCFATGHEIFDPRDLQPIIYNKNNATYIHSDTGGSMGFRANLYSQPTCIYISGNGNVISLSINPKIEIPRVITYSDSNSKVIQTGFIPSIPLDPNKLKYRFFTCCPDSTYAIINFKGIKIQKRFEAYMEQFRDHLIKCKNDLFAQTFFRKIRVAFSHNSSASISFLEIVMRLAKENYCCFTDRVRSTFHFFYGHSNYSDVNNKIIEECRKLMRTIWNESLYKIQQAQLEITESMKGLKKKEYEASKTRSIPCYDRLIEDLFNTTTQTSPLSSSSSSSSSSSAYVEMFCAATLPNVPLVEVSAPHCINTTFCSTSSASSYIVPEEGFLHRSINAQEFLAPKRLA